MFENPENILYDSNLIKELKIGPKRSLENKKLADSQASQIKAVIRSRFLNLYGQYNEAGDAGHVISAEEAVQLLNLNNKRELSNLLRTYFRCGLEETLELFNLPTSQKAKKEASPPPRP